MPRVSLARSGDCSRFSEPIQTEEVELLFLFFPAHHFLTNTVSLSLSFLRLVTLLPSALAQARVYRLKVDEKH